MPATASPPTFLHRVGQMVDSVVFALSPERGLRRRAFRERSAKLDKVQMRGLEASEANDTRGDRWLGSRLSVDDILGEDLETARHHSRELVRNDAIGGAVDARVNLVVGARFTAQSRIPKDARIGDDEQIEQIKRTIEAALEDWSLRCDPTGRRSLWQILRLAERVHATDGEAFVVLSDIGDADKEIPLTVEVIDSDRVLTPPEKANAPNIRLGIEYGRHGKIVAYWIRKENPFDSKTTDLSYERVPAERVLHIFEPWFAEQSRGLPWMIRVLNRLKDIKDLDEANIIAAQIEASFAAFVETADANPLVSATAAANGTTADGVRIQDIEPGRVQYLGNNQTVKFANPNRSGGSYGPFQEMNFRRVAGGMNFPFEIVMKNWSGVSFAGGRLALTDAKIDSQVRRRLLIEMMLMPIFWRFLDEAVLLGVVPIDPRQYRQLRSLYRKHVWFGPGWEYAINPVQENQANKDAVDANFKTRASVVSEMTGDDIESVDAERAKERQRERDLDIVPPDVAKAEAPAPTPEQAKQLAEMAA